MFDNYITAYVFMNIFLKTQNMNTSTCNDPMLYIRMHHHVRNARICVTIDIGRLIKSVCLMKGKLAR